MCQQLRQYCAPYLERDDALALRAPNNSREHLRSHLTDFDILIRQALLQDVHEPGDEAGRHAQQVPVEEHNECRQRVDPNSPRLFGIVLASASVVTRQNTHRRRFDRVDEVVSNNFNVLRGWCHSRQDVKNG